MGRRGPIQKTLKQMQLAGTARPARPRAERPPADVLDYVPEVPVHLAAHSHAEAQWKWLAPLLVRNGGLAEQDLNTLANLCLTQGLIIAAALGEIPFEPKGIHARYKLYGAALGLAPAWRARVAASEKEADVNPFEAFKGDKPN